MKCGKIIIFFVRNIYVLVFGITMLIKAKGMISI